MSERDFANLLFLCCTPTFSGLQIASLLSFRDEKKKMAHLFFQKYAQEINAKGIRLYHLIDEENYSLILFFHVHALEEVLSSSEVQQMLRPFGYEMNAPLEDVLAILKRRLKEGTQFPHEIGLFLGYPPCDVRGFIENKGKNFLSSGYWKVYANAGETLIKFRKCKQFTKDMHLKLQAGISFSTLILAS